MARTTKAFLGTRVVMLCAGHVTSGVDLQSDAQSINQAIFCSAAEVPFNSHDACVYPRGSLACSGAKAPNGFRYKNCE